MINSIKALSTHELNLGVANAWRPNQIIKVIGRMRIRPLTVNTVFISYNSENINPNYDVANDPDYLRKNYYEFSYFNDSIVMKIAKACRIDIKWDGFEKNKVLASAYRFGNEFQFSDESYGRAVFSVFLLMYQKGVFND